MIKLWKALSVLALLLWGIGSAQAQITGTVNLCGGTITFSAGSATADTNTSCTPWETYAYNVGVATPPYSSSIHIPALPNGSANTAAYIPGNALAEVGQANTFTAANTFNGGITVTTGLTATGLVTAADLFGTTGSGGNVVLATSPTISGLTVQSSFTATGLVTVADLATAAQSTTVNGQTCTLASTCTITATATSVTVGTTTINSGTNGRIEYNNAGTLGELPFTGTLGGAVVLVSSPTISGLTVTSSFTATGLVTNADLASPCCSSITQLGTITSGAWNGSAVPVQYGGSGANLSATGGANQVVQQTSAGGAFTVGQLAASNLSNGVTGSGAVVLTSGPTLGATTFSAGITASGLATTGTIANAICSTSAGVLISNNAANCFGGGSGAVSSVTGTTGQITATPTTGNVVVSLPATLTSSETGSGEWQFTGGALVPPVTSACGASITPTIATQNNECSVTAATTIHIPSPFFAGETYYLDLLEGATAFPITLAANVYVPGGGVAQLSQPLANDEDMLVCKTKVIGATNSLVCGQLLQLRQPPSWHVGCENTSGNGSASVGCSFTSPYTPPVGSVLLVGFSANTGTSTTIFSGYTFAGGTCVAPSANLNFAYNSSYGTGYYIMACQVTTAGATSITVNFSTTTAGGLIFADVVNNSFGIDQNNISTTATLTSTPTTGGISPQQQDMVWGWMDCGSCGTVTAGPGFTLGQNIPGVGQTEYGIFPAGNFPTPTFNAGTAAGYGAGVMSVFP